MKTTVTTENMVPIPPELSQRLDIFPGCQLEWELVEERGDEIRIRVVIPKRGEFARQL